MLTSPCSHCGAQAPLSLSLLHEQAWVCGFCGEKSVLSPEAQQSLRRGAEVLDQMDRQRLQLSASQRQALTGGRLWFQPMMTALVVVALVMALNGLSTVAEGFDKELPIALIIASSSFSVLFAVLFGAVVTGLWMRVRKQKKALLFACAAAPPIIPGGTAYCRVCGGPVEMPRGQSLEAQAIVRCSWCQADNLVSREAMAEGAAKQKSANQDIETQVHQAAQDLAQASMKSLAMGWVALMAISFLLMLISPLISGVMVAIAIGNAQ